MGYDTSTKRSNINSQLNTDTCKWELVNNREASDTERKESYTIRRGEKRKRRVGRRERAHAARSSSTSDFVLEDEDEVGGALKHHELRELLAGRAAQCPCVAGQRESRAEARPHAGRGPAGGRGGAGPAGGGQQRRRRAGRHERRSHAAPEKRLVRVDQRRELLESVVDVAHAHSNRKSATQNT